MARNRLLGLAAAAIVGGLALARRMHTDHTDTASNPRLGRPHKIRSTLSTDSANVWDALKARIPGKQGSTDSGLLSNYTLRAGVYLDHATDDSTLAFEWRRE